MVVQKTIFKAALRAMGLSAGFVAACLQCVQAASLLPVDDENQALREKFEEVEKAISTTPRSRLASLNNDFAELENYPLYPYLVRQRLFRDLTIRNRDNVEQFLSRYDGRPFVYHLRHEWLEYLGEHGHKDAFIASYRDGMGAAITCQYLAYQVEEATNPDYWLAKVDDIWLSGDSQPDECDPLFKQWEKRGFMSPENVLTRIELAATSGNARLIPYLQRRLPKDKQYLADLWSKVQSAPRTVLKASAFPLKHPQTEGRILRYGMERLAWQRVDDAIKAYYQWQPRQVFDRAQLNGIHRAIALSLAIDNKPDAKSWLERADVQGANEDVKRWHLAYLLRKSDWQEALKVIGTASDARQEDDNFMYWRARAFESLGMPQQANTLFKELAPERHFYGFMASARLSQEPSLMHAATPRDDATIDGIQKLPAARRAYEFLQLGRLIDARREWRYLISTLDSDKVKDAALLANEWGWYDQSIISFARSGYLNDVERRFPLAFAPEFSKVGQTYNIPPAFAMAIARRESSFMVDAVSPAGATGLMQLMPGTAQYLAETRVNRTTLIEPNRNVEFGVQYLRYLMDKLGDNPVLVSASYNAGWRRVMEWLPESDGVPTDIWIENIPYRETRAYVKAVMAYRYIYEAQLGAPTHLFNEIATQPIPSSNRLTAPASSGKAMLAPK